MCWFIEAASTEAAGDKDHLPVTSQRRVEVLIQSRQLALPGDKDAYGPWHVGYFVFGQWDDGYKCTASSAKKQEYWLCDAFWHAFCDASSDH